MPLTGVINFLFCIYFIIRQFWKYSYWFYVYILLLSFVLTIFVKRILYCIALYRKSPCSIETVMSTAQP